MQDFTERPDGPEHQELKHDTASAGAINHMATQDLLVINKQQTLAIELLSPALVPASGPLYGFTAENSGESEQTSAQFRAVAISVENNMKEG
ncbi:hypothetical protein Q7C36_000508 [Tachysurus vachellii]|uniref:Uncharacterized protein n=1 Tax=Tachysurus vachellii TaxID=175792 RepID=A0AA88T875_TACVA|nr:hypothetical protein Q7C36_000508 [Tachysurus vachellii]